MHFFSPRIVRALFLAAVLTFGLCPAAGAAENQAAQKPKNRVPGGAITSSSWPGGTSLAPGKLAISDHVSFAHGELRKGVNSHTNRNPRGAAVGQDDNDKLTNVFKVRYGIVKGWDIRVNLPFANNEINRHDPQQGTWKGGFNDIPVLVRYQVLPTSEGQPFCIAVDGGVTTPTGEVGENKVGTGAWGFILGGGASWIDDNQRVDVDVRYVAHTEGAHDVTPSNYFLSHGHYAYAVNDWFDVGAETNIRVAEASRKNGSSQDDANTEWYGGPKIQFRVAELNNLSFGTAVLFPIYRQYDSPKGRLSDDMRYEFRVGMVF